MTKETKMYSAIEVILSMYKTSNLIHPSVVEDAVKELGQLRDAMKLGQELAECVIGVRTEWGLTSTKSIELLKKYPKDSEYARMLIRQ
jgi:hypothetical protein